MKRILLAILLVVAVTASCMGADSTSGTAQNASSQDLLIKSEVETAVSMLQAIYTKHQQGEMTLEQAKKLGADLLRDLAYGDGGYFWAHTAEGTNVVMYRKDIEGMSRIGMKDVKGKLYVKEMLDKAAAGGGYVEYWYPRKGGSEQQPKRSYVLPFKPFGWVVGTGYYP